MKKLIALIIVAMFVLSGFAALAEGTLVMATNCAFPPYEYYDDETGEPTGIDVEIVKMIAEELGYEFKMEDMEFGSIITGVQQGKYDIGAGAITITEERKQSVNFTTPYETAIQQIVVLADSELNTMDAIRAADGLVIGVQQDTTGHYYAQDDLCADNSNTVNPYPVAATAIQALKSGAIDCVVVDNGPAQEFVVDDESLLMFLSDCAPEEYGFCFAKENTELFDAFNAKLEEKLADGTIDAILTKFKSEAEAE